MKFKSPRTAFLLASLICILFAAFATAHAQTKGPERTYTLLEPLPDLARGAVVVKVSFMRYISLAYTLLIGLAAFVSVFMIALGGFEYMVSDVISTKQSGLKRAQNAVWGLVLVLSSYMILYTIDPRFVKFSSNPIEPLNIPLNNELDQLNRIVTAEEKYDKQLQNAAELRQRAAAATDEEESIDLANQALKIEREAEAERAETQGYDLLNQTVKSLTSAEPSVDSVNNAEQKKDEIRKTYNTAIDALNKKGDSAGVVKLASERDYAVATIDSERDTELAIKAANGGSTSALYNAAVNSIKTISANDATMVRLIRDPGLKEKFQQESKARIDRIKTSIGYKEPSTTKITK